MEAARCRQTAWVVGEAVRPLRWALVAEGADRLLICLAWVADAAARPPLCWAAVEEAAGRCRCCALVGVALLGEACLSRAEEAEVYCLRRVRAPCFVRAEEVERGSSSVLSVVMVAAVR